MKRSVDQTLRGYMEAALFTGTDESDPSGGEPLDKNYSTSDIAASSRKAMRRDVVCFLRKNKRMVAAYVRYVDYKPSNGSVYEHLGHDFWLTRNGHGTGFWDRDYDGQDEIGKELTTASKKFGSSDIYVGDNGQLYVSPER